MSILAGSQSRISFSWCHTTPDAIFFIVLNRVIKTVLLNLAAIANRESFFSISPVFRFWKEYVWITIATVCLIAPVIDGSFRLGFGIR